MLVALSFEMAGGLVCVPKCGAVLLREIVQFVALRGGGLNLLLRGRGVGMHAAQARAGAGVRGVPGHHSTRNGRPSVNVVSLM